jgi:mono/diheme cytochrome c family protein
MSNETLFFICGIALVVIAVVVSFVGLRLQKFPQSRALLVGGVGLVMALVVTTAVFAWRNGEDEKAHKAEELAAASAENEASGNTVEADEETGSNTGESTTSTTTSTTTPSGSETTTTVDTAAGAELFNSQGCSGCHTLSAAGSSGTTGPNLDGALADKSADFIRTSIVNPADEVAEGYPPGVMPENFGETLSPEQIDELVAYLVESTSGSSQ